MQLLLLPDYDIVLSTLGALYCLSLFESQVALIVSVDGLIDTLMSMLWIDNITEDAVVPTTTFKHLYVMDYTSNTAAAQVGTQSSGKDRTGEQEAETTSGACGDELSSKMETDVESSPVCLWNNCLRYIYACDNS